MIAGASMARGTSARSARSVHHCLVHISGAGMATKNALCGPPRIENSMEVARSPAWSEEDWRACEEEECCRRRVC